MQYQDLINIINNECDVKVEFRERSVGMQNHYHPLSLTNLEFNFITDFVKSHNLKRGYEVATAFGFSSLAAGLGFRETGGKLVTMDAYIEEQYNNCGAYIDKQSTHMNADGLRLAQFLHNKFDTPVYLEIGWSPDDTKKVLENHYDLSKDKLDYVLIDGNHAIAAIRADINSVVSYLDPAGYVVFFHDIQCFDGDLMAFVKSRFNKLPTEPFTRNQNDNYGLAYISTL